MAQQVLGHIFDVAGTPFAQKKRQHMQPAPIFLGQVNDFTRLPEEEMCYVRPKPGRADKVKQQTQKARAENRLTSAAAAKLRGLLQAYGTAVQGHIARGGSQPLTERQYSATGSALTPLLERSLDYIDAMVDLAPPRGVPMRRARPVVAAWSDAEYDYEHPERGGGVGYIIKYPDRQGVGAATRVPPGAISHSLERRQQIGELEALVPLMAILNVEALYGYDVWWGIDNTSAEASLVRGYSSKADTAAIVAATHIVMARRDLRIFYFHVDSDSNPSDGLSRDGLDDVWTRTVARQHGWRLYEATLPDLAGLMELPIRQLIDAFERQA